MAETPYVPRFDRIGEKLPARNLNDGNTPPEPSASER
jgi:hypothetical protein